MTTHTKALPSGDGATQCPHQHGDLEQDRPHMIICRGNIRIDEDFDWKKYIDKKIV